MIEKEDFKLIEELTSDSKKKDVKELNKKCKLLLHLFELQNELQKTQENLSKLTNEK